VYAASLFFRLDGCRISMETDESDGDLESEGGPDELLSLSSDSMMGRSGIRKECCR
jgi:hypothetical protein